jgi:hypothetical protein
MILLAYKGLQKITLSTQQKDMAWITQISQREGWQSFFGFGLAKTSGGTAATLEAVAPTCGTRGVFIPLYKRH